MSPMAHKNNDSEVDSEGKNDDDEIEATKSNAETHIKCFQDNFKFYNLDLFSWCKCFISENCKVNLRIARISKIPLVGCNNHKLSLEVNSMIESTASLKNTIDEVRKTMDSAKNKIINAAMLRNLT